MQVLLRSTSYKTGAKNHAILIGVASLCYTKSNESTIDQFLFQPSIESTVVDFYLYSYY